MADLGAVADKLSFVSKLTLLFKATSDDSEPTPGYMYDEIIHISYESGTYCEELEDWLNDRLDKRSSYVKLKVLKIMKNLVAKGHPKFRQNLRKKSQGIVEATKHSGPPDALHGNAQYLAVRREAQELSSSLFTIDDDDTILSDSTTGRTSVKGIGSMKSSGLQGFGNTANTASRSIGETLIDGLQDLAERVVDSMSSSSHRNDVTFVVPSGTDSFGLFPGYKPIAPPSVDSMNPRKHHPEIHRNSRDEAVYRPGVAGGGWDDDEDDDCERQQISPDRLLPNFDSSAMYGDDVMTCDKQLSAESKLVNDLVLDSDVPIPTRSELKEFVTRCSGVSCEKVVELLAVAMAQSPIAVTMRSLLAVEALLRTDLVTPRHIAVTCHKQLLVLYTSISSEESVRQKSRKLIRILEKLAPKQAALFAVETTITTNADAQSPIGGMSTAQCQPAPKLTTTAFPFLLMTNS